VKHLRTLQYFVWTVVMFVGLPLLGRGIDDLGGFFARSARAGHAPLAAACALAIAGMVVAVPDRFHAGPSQGEKYKLVRRQHLVRDALVGGLYAALVLMPCADRRNP
jgi:hypothetical protein